MNKFKNHKGGRYSNVQNIDPLIKTEKTVFEQKDKPISGDGYKKRVLGNPLHIYNGDPYIDTTGLKKNIFDFNCFQHISIDGTEAEIASKKYLNCIILLVNRIRCGQSKTVSDEDFIEFLESKSEEYSIQNINIRKLIKDYDTYYPKKENNDKLIVDYFNFDPSKTDINSEYIDDLFKKEQKKQKKIDDNYYENNKTNIIKGGILNYYDNTEYTDLLREICATTQFRLNKTTNEILDEIHRYNPVTARKQFIKQQIIDYIQTYNIPIQLIKEFTYNNYDVNDHRLPRILDRTYSRNYECKEYNKDIVLSYEYADQQVFDNLRDYIRRQDRYIQTLSNRQKNMIKDYSRPESYNFLNYFINDPRPGFLLVADNRAYIRNMGNAFCDIIFDIYEIDDATKELIKDKNFIDLSHEIYTRIDENGWREIFTRYMTELNIIILNAPETAGKFVCFRGSKTDYIQENDTMINMRGSNSSVFLSNGRFSSISIKFDTAKQFYLEGAPGQRIIFRIMINHSCRLLFVPPLTELKGEMEFLVPLSHVFVARDNHFRPEDIINGYDYGDNICLDHRDQIKSKDMVLLPF